MDGDDLRYKVLKDFSRILALFERQESEEINVNYIAKSLKVLPSKVSRMLKTLEADDLFEKNPETGKYRVGSRFLRAGLLYALNHPLRRLILPHLEQVAKDLGFLTGWGIFKSNKVVLIDRIGFDNSPTIHLIGSDIPLHSSAYGRLFLAYAPIGEQERILKSLDLVKFTDATISDLPSLREELRKVRERGYSIDEMETRDNIVAIAAPILDSQGNTVAAVGISGKRLDLTAARLPELATYLKERTLFISRQLGYSF